MRVYKFYPFMRFFQKWFVFRLGVLLVVGLTAACGGAPQQIPSELLNADRQLDAASSASLSGADAEMKRALSVYEAYDDRDRQWRANFQLANWYLAQNRPQSALTYAVRAEALSRKLDEAHKRYASLIQLGQLGNDSEVFERALSLAVNPEERALALVLLHRYDKVAHILERIDTRKSAYPASYIYYRYALAKNDLSVAKQALDLYRSAGDHYGIVDSLFLCAQLAKDRVSAVDFAERALLSAKYLPSQRRAESIGEWLQAN